MANAVDGDRDPSHVALPLSRAGEASIRSRRMDFTSVEAVERALSQESYLADRGLATAVYLSLAMRRPLLLEGEAGVGKTDVAKTLARLLDAELIRLQCYEGIDASAHAALRSDARWEAFCFGTRLTRITRALARTDAREALRRATAEVVDWSGGTRIGDAVRALSRTNVVRGAVVVVCSDGLDVGDPELLRDEMARLPRLARRVVWLNPLKEDPAYEPLARGMQAALPHVDAFLSGHNLDSLEALAASL